MFYYFRFNSYLQNSPDIFDMLVSQSKFKFFIYMDACMLSNKITNGNRWSLSRVSNIGTITEESNLICWMNI